MPFTQVAGSRQAGTQTRGSAVHVPLWQIVVDEHARPQVPQLEWPTLRLASQPFALEPSQSAQPALQTRVHRPPLHADVALETAGQTFPHAPQLFRSVAVLTSHPLALLPSQLL